jgi:hypothetical protein
MAHYDPQTQPQSDDLTTNHPIYQLARAVVRAWGDEAYRGRLLSYPNIIDRSEWMKKGIPNYESTKNALDEVIERSGFTALNIKKPVILTCPQYNWGYVKQSSEEIVLVLPTSMALIPRSVGGARLAMTFCPAGM